MSTPRPLPNGYSTYQYQHRGSSSASISPNTFGARPIPLNLIAFIISFFDDDPATLASLCRTSRVLYYMTLPHLWRDVVLRAYSGIRYKDGCELPEGVGGASPFSMGLNAFVSHNVAGLVRTLALEGSWEGYKSDLQRCSRAGRVSESAMLLGIAVRAAIDRCGGMEGFKWDLETKMPSNVYAGLAAREHLRSFHLRFPDSRTPQPTGEIPAMPHLREFTMTHYDPLCYPDDVSRLLLHATNLEVLNLHFSPRMREQGEPSVQVEHMFRRNVAAKQRLRLKKLGIYNLFSRPGKQEMLLAVDETFLEDFTVLNTFGADEGECAPGVNGVNTTFFDQAWIVKTDDCIPEDEKPPIKQWRIDQLHRAHLPIFQWTSHLERLYLINPRYGKSAPTPSSSSASPQTAPLNSATSTCSNSAAGRQTPTTPSPSSTSLKELYLKALCAHCGPRLKHLIFPNRWPLSSQQAAQLIRSCPNLTQLSCALVCEEYEILRVLIPFLSKLYAFRVQITGADRPCDHADGSCKDRIWSWISKGQYEEMLSVELSNGDLDTLKYLEMADTVFEIGGSYQSTEQVPVETGIEEAANSPQYEERVVTRRRVKRIGLEDVKHVEIWKYDSLDVI